MGHRDDREAERARIEALERELAEANERAARAEAEVAAARARADDVAAQRLARERAAQEARAKKAPERTRAERRAEKRARDASRAEAPSERGAWPADASRRYFRGSAALSLLTYGATAGAMASQAALGLDAMSEAGYRVGLGAAMANVLLHAALGRYTHAPGIWSGAIVTLLSSAVTFGGALAVAIAAQASLGWLVSGPLLEAARALAVTAALVAGALVTAFWSADAARSPPSSD